MEIVTLHITGMACGGCANTVRQALLALEGVTGAEVSHAEATAEVSFDPSMVQLSQLRLAIERAGYKVAA